MTRSLMASLCVVLAVTLIALPGCGSDEKSADKNGHSHGKKDDHKDDHPETYAEAVAAVEDIRKQVQEASEADDLEQAHGPLHQIGHLLDELGSMAKKEGMSEDDQKEIEEAVNALMDAFTKIDEKLHGDGSEGSMYADVATEIEDGMKVLTSKCEDEG